MKPFKTEKVTDRVFCHTSPVHREQYGAVVIGVLMLLCMVLRLLRRKREAAA